MNTLTTSQHRSLATAMRLAPDYTPVVEDGGVSLYRGDDYVARVSRGVVQTYDRNAETARAAWRVAARVYHQSRSTLGPLV